MHTGQNGETWVRLRYTEHPVYLRGNMFSSLSVLALFLFLTLTSFYYKSNLELFWCILSGDFFDSEEFGFYLHPVFADGEGEAVYAIGMLTTHVSVSV